MRPLEGARTVHSQRRGLVLIVSAAMTALMLGMTLATTAQATPNAAYAWGLNSSGQLGDGTSEGPEKCGEELRACSTTPVPVSGLTGVVALAGGGEFESTNFSLALLENGTVMAWGADPGGALGDGSTGSSDVPVPVCAVAASTTTPCSEPSEQLKEVVAISAGADHAIAVLKDGTVVTWGQIAFGGLGDGKKSSSSVPVRVCAVGTPSPEEREEKGEEPGCPGGPYLAGVTAISTGSRFFLAVSSGTVVAWGQDSGEGNLGNGKTSGTSWVPAPVCAVGTVGECPTGPYLTGATAVSSTSGDSLALLSGGKVAAWGSGQEGQLGNGTEAQSDVPVEVSGLSGVTAIAAGGELINGGSPHMIALLENGTVEAWGNNQYGQLGVGMSTPPGPEQCGSFKAACAKTPVAVSGLSGVTAIAARGHHSLALNKAGDIFAWGENNYGQLGDGMSEGPEHCSTGFQTFACSSHPVSVAYPGTANGIGAGVYHSLAFGPPPPPPTNLPELGRCRKLTTKTGAYGGTSNVCLRLSKTHTGYFEWMPGPGSNRTFKETLSSPKLETAGKKKFSCTLMFVKGEYTGAKTETVTSVVLEGCEEAFHHQNCSSGPSSGTNLESAPGTEFEGELGFIVGGEKPQVGWDLKPKSPASSFFSFTCGPTSTSSEVLTLEGSVIGRALPIDKMVSGFGLRYGQSGGVQLPERFEGGVKDTLLLKTALPGPPPSESSEQIGVKTEGSVEDGEELEIKAKV